MIDRASIKERGKEAFKANYWMCVVGALVTGIAAGGGAGGGSSSSGNNYSDLNNLSNADPEQRKAIIAIIMAVMAVVLVATLLSAALRILVLDPLLVGCNRFFIQNQRGCAAWSDLGFGFKNGAWKNVVKTMFMYRLFIFLWSLLLVIPGIVKSYEYLLVPYLLAEDPELSWEEAHERSKNAMDGNKMDAFVFGLSFIGWILLSLLTCGILSIFYVNPYIFASKAELYLVLTNQGSNAFGGSMNFGGAQNFGGTQNYGDTQNYGGTQNYAGTQNYGGATVDQSQYGAAPQDQFGTQNNFGQDSNGINFGQDQ